MSSPDLQPRERSAFERHAQTVIGGVGLAVVIWVGATLLDLSREQVRTSEQMSQVRQALNIVQDQLGRLHGERYLQSDARRDFEVTNNRMRAIEDRLEKVERRR
jgi:hypothetical protein